MICIQTIYQTCLMTFSVEVTLRVGVNVKVAPKEMIVMIPHE
jgi:hypothetical protein